MLMLTLDDAVAVTKELSAYNDRIIRTELEQKCWIPEKNKDVMSMINDINTVEIADHIVNEDLGEWCRAWQVNMIMKLKSSGLC